MVSSVIGLYEVSDVTVVFLCEMYVDYSLLEINEPLATVHSIYIYIGWAYHNPPDTTFYIFSQIYLLNFMRHAAQSQFFPAQNAMYFTMVHKVLHFT